MTSSKDGLQGLRVVCFESRRATEIAELVRRHGGEPYAAPALREVAQQDTRPIRDYLLDLEAGRIDVGILLTGVGLRTMVQVAGTDWPAERIAGALRRARLVARGPKPAAALRELGLQPDLLVPAPNTWREILIALDAHLPVSGKTVAVQEYGVPNTKLSEALRTRGANVRSVGLYQWALPEDLSPLREGIRRIVAGSVDIAVFTSATQVVHLFQVAGLEESRLRHGLANSVVASIGPICSEALRDQEVNVDLEPEQGKMGHLLALIAREAPSLLEKKRSSVQAKDPS